MTVSARLKRAYLAASALAMALSGLAGAQGWRGDPALAAEPGIPINALAQAQLPAWNAARLDHFFDAATMRAMPNLESGNSPFARALPRAARNQNVPKVQTPMQRPLLVPEPKLTNSDRPTFEALSRESQRTDRYDDLIVRDAAANSLNPRLVKAVIAAESVFKFNAHSSKGARGLMQVMPHTAVRLGIRPSELTDPESNLKAGTAYLAELFRLVARFYGLHMDSFLDPPLWLTERVIACYHAGPSYLRHGHWLRQTKSYVRRVLLFYRSEVTRFHWAPPVAGFVPGTWQTS